MMNSKVYFKYKDNFLQIDDIESELRYGQKMQEKPLVSILMPSYNHSDYLERALCSAINQNANIPYEIIIVDNNHPEHQFKNECIVKGLKSDKVCYYVNKENLGACGNWNRCIELAQGDYVTFCHDDDMLLPDTLDVLLNSVSAKNPKRLIIGSNIDIDSSDKIIREKNGFFDSFSYNYSKFLFLVNNPNNGCGSLFHRSSLIELGGYDPDYYPTFDYAMNVNYSSIHGAVKISCKTFKYRITESSESATCYKEIPRTVEMISSSILANICLFKRIARRASMISLKISSQMSALVWEGKKPSVSLMDRLYLSLYIKVVTLLNIRFSIR